MFQLQRLYQSSPDSADIHGFTTDRIALDARIRPSATPGGLMVDFRVQNTTEEMNVRVAVQLSLNGEADPRWMVPGFFYGNNKPAGCTRLYPSYSEINRDPRRLMSNHWAFRSDRAAIPLACVWTYGAFTYLLTDGTFGRTKENPRGIGMTGLYLGTEDGHPSLAVEFPYRESPVKFSYCHEDKMEPEEIFVFLPEKIPLMGSFQLGIGRPDLHAYSSVIRSFYRDNNGVHQTRARMAPEWAEHSAHTGLLRWHYDGRTASIFEQTAFDRPIGKRPGPNEHRHMHAGWQSGALPAYALLWAGRETKHVESITAGTAVLNKFCSQLSPAGTIFPVWTEEHGWSCSFGPEEGAAHSRTVAEAVLFILRAIALELNHNASHPQWVEAALSSLNYAMGAQREDGAFPCYYDLATGSARSYEGCGGLPWIAALAMGALLVHRPHYKDVAIRAGDYYRRFIDSEMIYGCVEDQYLVPTCEDCHWAVISYVLLYELDRDIRWLKLARKAADLATTWRFGYNVSFSAESMLGRNDLRTRGGDICSAATPVLGCYGLLSYREFLKLAAYTADEYYLERAEDARAFATQLIAREEGQLNGRAGMVAAHCFHTDWLQPKGVIHLHSHAMASAIIKYAELSRRNLNISRLTYDAARGGAIEEELTPDPVMYSDIALSEESDVSELSSGLVNAMGINQPPGGGISQMAEGIFSMPSQDDVVLPSSGDLLAGLSREFNLPGPPAPSDRNRNMRPTAPPPVPGPGQQKPLQRPATPSGGFPSSQNLSSRTSGVRQRPPSIAQEPGPRTSGDRFPRSVTPPNQAPPAQSPREPSRVSGINPRPDRRSSQDAPADVRAMTNAISSALGLGPSSSAPPPQRDRPPTKSPSDTHAPPSAPFQPRTPMPFTESQSDAQSPDTPSRSNSDEVEIKYKIF
jgi:hypothetical protein